jgi:hypothetical protein
MQKLIQLWQILSAKAVSDAAISVYSTGHFLIDFLQRFACFALRHEGHKSIFSTDKFTIPLAFLDQKNLIKPHLRAQLTIQYIDTICTLW